MGRHQFRTSDDERDTLDCLWRRGPVQNRVLAEARSTPSRSPRSSAAMANPAFLWEARRLGLRKWAPPRPEAILGTGDLAQVHPTTRARTWNRKTNRLAHVPAYVFDFAQKRGDRIQGDARAVAAYLLRSTLDVYTQAITPAKHAAQAAVMSLVFSPKAEYSEDVLWGDRRPVCCKRKNSAQSLREKAAERGTEKCPFCAPFEFRQLQLNSFEMNGGDDGARTRDLCRDRAVFWRNL